MNKQLADELRDVNLELEGLKARKDAIKKKALEHRDNLTKVERDAMLSEASALKEQIKKLENRRDELSASAEKNEQGENETMNNTILHFKEGIERVEIFSTAEYRSAYFKTMQGRELNETEKRAITSASSSGGAKDLLHATITDRNMATARARCCSPTAGHWPAREKMRPSSAPSS